MFEKLLGDYLKHYFWNTFKKFLEDGLQNEVRCLEIIKEGIELQ